MAADYSNLSVLVIDDQQVARQWDRGVLESLGIERVVEASSGREAMQAVTERGARFDLILCDLRMPGKDGIETIRMLASLGLDCAVAILSVEDERVIESAGLLATMRGLNLVGAVSKPLTVEKLELILQGTTEAHTPKVPVAIDLAESELAEALSRGELEMHYQPKIQMFSGECVGAEATIHWMHPRHGHLGAGAVVPVAERAPKLLAELTTFTLRQAITTCGRWHMDGRGIGVSVNVSPLAFDQLDLPDVIERVATEANVLPGSITIEVAEATLPDNLAMMVDIVARLRIKGFRVALDGFTGRHSAVEEFLGMPFSELKLDRAFVAGCSAVPGKRAVVEAGLAIARNLKLSTVAVGVAQRPDWDLLADLGCEVAQGHFIARPMPEMGFDIWLPQWIMHKQRR
jgi:EAL domain-containing protein (putative c-di-GMP-specific phosphodiesterase class I)/ActR/RegA family two-component response regulator